jgi:hypothetical protein
MALRSDAAVPREPGSGVVAAVQPRATLSHRLWGLDWSAVLPWSFDGVALHAGTFEDALPFIAEHYPRIFDGADRFYQEGMSDAKRRFGDEMDVFVFRDGEKTAGVIAAHPTDWSTYYVRTFALLPEYRDKGLAHGFGKSIGPPLAAVGCRRWEVECSPANARMVHLMVDLGGVATGTSNSERFGQMLRFTVYLNAEAEGAFREHYVFGGPTPRREQGQRKPEERRER